VSDESEEKPRDPKGRVGRVAAGIKDGRNPGLVAAGEMARDKPRVRRVIESMEEGAPLEVAAAEEALGDKRQRARLGKAGMLTALLVWLVFFPLDRLGIISESLSEQIFPFFMGIVGICGVGGLILWYRTK
jgi:hypothetical protein